MTPRKRFVPVLAAAAIAAATSGVLAESYTITFNDLAYVPAGGYYGQTIPVGYQPPELAGSGISISSWGDTYLFYGASAPIGTNDATYQRTGAGSGASLAGSNFVFDQPVYVTRTAISSYHIPAVSNSPEDIAAARMMTLEGYTNASDATPAITVNIALSLHAEAWRGTMTWRDTIALQNTPIQKLAWDSPGFGELDDITVSTSAGTNLLADFNVDGVVDVGDYTIWADTYDIWSNPAYVGTSRDGPTDAEAWVHGVDLRADANLNGFIDVGDYTVWADSYGEGAAAAVAALSVVPEPTSLGFLGLAGAAMLYRRRA